MSNPLTAEEVADILRKRSAEFSLRMPPDTRQGVWLGYQDCPKCEHSKDGSCLECSGSGLVESDPIPLEEELLSWQTAAANLLVELTQTRQHYMDEARRWKARYEAAEQEVKHIKAAMEESEHAMHMRIRAGYDKTIADSWRAEVEKLRTALELSEVDVSLERTWCRICRTENRSIQRRRDQHPHERRCCLYRQESL